MCGIVGMVGVSAVNQRIYDALTVLQHRGQDAAGIMTSDAGELFMRKDSGLVRDVFQQKHMLKLKGNLGIGHVRYPTAGSDSSQDAQPFYVNSPYGICLGHNGNLTNALVSLQGQHVLLLEHIAYQPGSLARAQPPFVRGHDAGGILAAMLQHRQRIVQALVDGTGANDTDDAAHDCVTVP